jgi:hypothetical protein
MGTKIVAVSVVAALARALVTVGPLPAASADGRSPVGLSCTNPNALPKPGACISLAFGEQSAQGYTGSPDRELALRPGTYWLSLNDTSTAHNFMLESPAGSEQDLTEVAAAPGWVTVKVTLTPGTWVLFCDRIGTSECTSICRSAAPDRLVSSASDPDPSPDE